MKKWQFILFIIGMSVLGVIALLSLAGIIYTFFKSLNDTLLTVSSSLFISAISSLLTIGALITTINSNNKLYRVQYEENETLAARVLNHMNDTLILNKIEIYQFLQNKEITHYNKSAKEVKANKLQIIFYFTMGDLSNLKCIGIREFKQFTRTDECECPPLTVNIKSNPKYYEVHSIDENTFYYVINTNINNDVFKKFRKHLLKNGDCVIGTYLDIDIMDVAHRTRKCEIRSKCKYLEFNTKRNVFVFEKI